MVKLNLTVSIYEGGCQAKFGVHKEGVGPDSTNTDKRREGVKNPENFADLLYKWPLIFDTL